MNYEPRVMGNAFSEWSQLTLEYAQGMEALRRREPGASIRMIELATEMQRFQKEVMGASDGFGPKSRATAAPGHSSRSWPSWINSTFEALLGIRQQSSVGRTPTSYS